MPDIGTWNPDHQVSIPYPEIPTNMAGTFTNLLQALERTSSDLQSHADHIQGFMTQTTGAVEYVTSQSEGKAKQTLAQTWTLSQIDGLQAQTSMRTAATHLRAAVAALIEEQPAILKGIATLATVQSTGGKMTVDAADEVRVLINDFTNALNNVGMGLDAAATVINKMNSNWPQTCATGFASGSNYYPTFAPNAFGSLHASGQMNMTLDGVGDPELVGVSVDPAMRQEINAMVQSQTEQVAEAVIGETGMVKLLRDWKILSIADKEGILKQMTEVILQTLASPIKNPISLKIEDLPYGTDSEYRSGQIQIDPDVLQDDSPGRALSTVMNETYHVYQENQRVAALGGLIEPGPALTQADLWLNNQSGGYFGATLDQIEMYFDQPREASAYNFERLVINQLNTLLGETIY